MKKKFSIYIFFTVSMLIFNFIAGATLTDVFDPNEYLLSRSEPIPGDMKGDLLDYIYKYEQLNFQNQINNEIYYDDDLVDLMIELNESLYLKYLEDLVDFGPRVTGEQACFSAGEYIYNEFLKMGLDARIQEWQNGGLEGTNIEATIHGINESSDDTFVICAHYDSVPDCVGADDDGSGVAAVMAVAYVMSNYRFDNTIHFVAFSGEEQGLYGSYYYVEDLYNHDENVVAALNADMIGFAEDKDDDKYVVIYEDDYSTWITDFTSEIADTYNELLDLEVISGGYTWGSDHYRFWEFGYNAIFYAEAHFSPHWHEPSDIIENMDINYAVRISRLMLSTLAELSGLNMQDSPLKPGVPEGPTQGKIDTEYTFASSTYDPQDDQLYYIWDWGNGVSSEWMGPYNSGDICEAKYLWSEKGKFGIKVRAKDINGYLSEWSDPLVISMPKYNVKYLNKIFIQFLDNNPRLISFLKIFI